MLHPARDAGDNRLALDSVLYVAATGDGSSGEQDSSYAVFRSASASKVPNDTTYNVFRSAGLEHN